LSEPYRDAPCNYYHEESGGRYPALPAAQSRTIPMLATPAKTTPMLATNNYYQARPNKVEAKKNRPRTPKRPRPDTARRPQGLKPSVILYAIAKAESFTAPANKPPTHKVSREVEQVAQRGFDKRN